MITYRQLLDKEIATLTVYGCTSNDWKCVQVAEDFSAAFITNVHFSGNVFLGTYNLVFEQAGGLKKHAGISNCIIHNCIIGNDVYIDNIQNYIANYHIHEGAYIENINALVVDGISTFGNGVRVATMIESGEREIPIFDQLSAPLAYIMTFYRHNTALTEKLKKQVLVYTEKHSSDIGNIGKNARIINCGSLKNVRVGDYAQLDGVTFLQNGTIVSNEQAPVIIGSGVQCDNFIIQSGSVVTEGAMVTRCFIGQGCLIGKQFSAIDSLFFANCQGLHGEAVSVFAGPYTVSHHKSTLMLTALFSFMNAGSGTNFSNHMYKLGPVHQGITERGVKTSSNSYIMWPARIGAFSVVLGTHKGNPDISDLPFSYLIETDGDSFLVPGINLHSAGTVRDIQKWPKRDLRNGDKIDPICFAFLSPYTISKALKGIEILNDLLEKMDANVSFVWYQNCKMKRSSIRKGIELYEMAIDSFIANNITEKVSMDSTKSDRGTGQWVDMAGLLAPKSEVENLINRIVLNEMNVEAIQNELLEIYSNYTYFSQNFAVELLQKRTGKTIEKQNFDLILEVGKKADQTFNELILKDARKEFNSISKIGFGIDGDENDKLADFEATRGKFDGHPFIIERKVMND